MDLQLLVCNQGPSPRSPVLIVGKIPSLQHIIYLLECEEQKGPGEGGGEVFPFFFAFLLEPPAAFSGPQCADSNRGVF